MIIAMAGLPGTGKTTLACALAKKLPALVLSKDIVRSALFPPQEIEYSKEQDDFVFGILLNVAEYCLHKNPERFIILDGRTFSKKTQVDTLITYSTEHRRELRIIYCRCSNETVRERLNRAAATGEHPASNRGYDLYLKLQAQEEPLVIAHLGVDTGDPLEENVNSCLDYLNMKS